MSTGLSPQQVDYLKNVLGVDTLVLDAGLAPSAANVRISQVQPAPKLLILIASASQVLPLEGDAHDLTMKMIQAMKLGQSDIVIAEWTLASASQLPPSVAEVVGIFPHLPILIFGNEGAAAVGLSADLGEWQALGAGRVMVTHSPAELLRRADLKKAAWTHLQKVMKVIG